MRVIGIDPGVSHLGFGVVDTAARDRLVPVASGTIRTNPRCAFQQRLSDLHCELEKLFHQYGPEHMAIEEVFFAKNVRSALLLGQARGVVLLSAALAHIPVFEYSATEIKKALCSYGHAGKDQIQAMVKVLLGLEGLLTDHASDALAASICHAHSFRPPVAACAGSRGCRKRAF
ncbi:MAG: crossover junction endodeoxyribonuclease RuvC [bacterium]